MRKHIENLKQKPTHVRRRYALAYTALIMAVIVTIWASSFRVKISQIQSSNPLPVGTVNNSLSANSLGVWSVIKNSIVSVFRSSDSYNSSDSASGNIIVTGSADKY